MTDTNTHTTCCQRRNTPVRRALVDLLDQASHPVTAATLIDGLAASGLEANKTTVYRQLDAMIEHGVVRKVDLGDGRARFELSGDEGHPHLLCTRCGSVSCLPVDDALVQGLRRMAAEQGFELEGCSVELRGICATCKEETTS